MSEEQTLADRATEMARRLRGEALCPPGPIFQTDVANLLDDLIAALTQPAPLVPAAETLQAIAERGHAAAWLRAQGDNAMRVLARNAIAGAGIDERTIGMVLGAYQSAELIEAKAHVPPAEKVEEDPQS